MNIKNVINELLKQRRYKGSRNGYNALFEKIIEVNHFKEQDLTHGRELTQWLDRWKKYDDKLSPISYQIFSRYIGNDINIMPMEVLSGIVEPVLIPESYRDFYSDKNSLDLLFHDLSRPQTLARNIEGLWYDKNYIPTTNPLGFIDSDAKPDRIILKPTRDCSGHGVKLYVLKDRRYIDSEGNSLTLDYLSSQYKSNFLIQNAIVQSPFMSQFNPSSVNTLRVATYRSVKTGQVHVINAIIRIGASGKNVDNAHSGGMFVGVDKTDGMVGKYVCDYLGHTGNRFNNVDFEHNTFTIPEWENVCAFAKSVSERIIQHNLVALDIALDEMGNPVLIETNIGGFSGWLFQFTNGSVFGEFTDEVMDYCWDRYKHMQGGIILKK